MTRTDTAASRALLAARLRFLGLSTIASSFVQGPHVIGVLGLLPVGGLVVAATATWSLVARRLLLAAALATLGATAAWIVRPAPTLHDRVGAVLVVGYVLAVFFAACGLAEIATAVGEARRWRRVRAEAGASAFIGALAAGVMASQPAVDHGSVRFAGLTTTSNWVSMTAAAIAALTFFEMWAAFYRLRTKLRESAEAMAAGRPELDSTNP